MRDIRAHLVHLDSLRSRRSRPLPSHSRSDARRAQSLGVAPPARAPGRRRGHRARLQPAARDRTCAPSATSVAFMSRQPQAVAVGLAAQQRVEQVTPQEHRSPDTKRLQQRGERAVLMDPPRGAHAHLDEIGVSASGSSNSRFATKRVPCRCAKPCTSASRSASCLRPPDLLAIAVSGVSGHIDRSRALAGRGEVEGEYVRAGG